MAPNVSVSGAAYGSARPPPNQRKSEQLLDVKALAARLAVSPRTVQRMADAGHLPGRVNLLRSVRWRESDIDRWLADGCRPVEVR